MKLINADYLTGRIFTEADLTNAHTCYESIMAIIESMESEDVLDKIIAEIDALPKTYPFINHIDTYVKEDDVKRIIDKNKGEQK